MKIIGHISLPGDKSISHRSALFGSFSGKISKFENFNFNNDCSATLNCIKMLGVDWKIEDDKLVIYGKSINEWQPAEEVLNAENSGTTTRLISAILANLSFSTEISGDQSLQKRPMKRIIDPLTQMGAKIQSQDGFLPLKFSAADNLQAIKYKLPMASAQVKSAVLLSGLFAEGETEVIEDTPTRDHTERMLGLKVVNNSDGSRSIFSSRKVKIPDLSMTIPGDFSSAAFFIAAALLIPNSELLIENVSLNPTRTGLLGILKDMGADLQISKKQQTPEPVGDILVKYSQLHNIKIAPAIIPNIIDEIPILAILASSAAGDFELRNAEELRYKESDRITAIVNNLQNTGIEVEELKDGFKLKGEQKFSHGDVKTYGDHRIAMSFAIANLLTNEEITLDDPACADVSFPQFWSILKEVTVS
jgi:3-phosphoshikimate 1-carboxyvinyltransferase